VTEVDPVTEDVPSDPASSSAHFKQVSRRHGYSDLNFADRR
jgi:hypothetical protein